MKLSETIIWITSESYGQLCEIDNTGNERKYILEHMLRPGRDLNPSHRLDRPV